LVMELHKRWGSLFESWAYRDEQQSEQKRWAAQDALFFNKWNDLENKIKRPGDYEMRLDQLTENLRKWIQDEYKLPTATWKQPRMNFKSFGPSCVNLSLDCYVDDIRLEHNERKRRVVTEVAKAICLRFQEEGIHLIPPQ
jgi:hypothetical protein